MTIAFFSVRLLTSKPTRDKATCNYQTMENEIADKRCQGGSPALRITHGSTLAISVDTTPAAPQFLEATAIPAEVKQDNVGTVVPDNMVKGETSADDYDGFGDMRNEADQFQTQFAAKDTRGGWTNFGQLHAWGHGTGGGDTGLGSRVHDMMMMMLYLFKEFSKES